MAKRIRIKWNWLMCAIVIIITGIVVVNTALVNGEIIPEGWGSPEAEGAYRPYPILFLHGFAGGSNYTWNPDPNADNQAEEQKKPTAVLEKYFRDYFDVNKALNNLTQFPYLETIEFFNSKSSPPEQLMDRNSSVDRFKLGDYYVEHGVWWHKKQEGAPGWADKVSYALRGEPPHELSKYLYDDSPGIGGGPVLQNYLPPNASSFKALLICHSMGGLSAREYLTNKTFYPGVEKNVYRLITIDTPHLGSALAVLADATVEVQRIATSVSIAYPQFGWLMAAPVVIEVVDNGLELIGKIDIDGDAVNDMDPLSLLGRFSSGFLGQLNTRAHPQGVQYYIVYGSLPFAQIIDGFSIQGFINSLMGKGISIEEVEELLEKEYGAEIGIGEIIATGIGDGVVSENSQRGILRKEENKPIRVFEIAKESIKGIPIEIGVNADHSAATKKVVEIEVDDVPPLLKLIDYTKPRLEIASPQEGFIWESGAPITLDGKVYDEYLPADSSLKIELYKAGDNFNPVFSEIRKPDPITGYTPLKPTTLWNPNNPSSPVAEFREDVMLPSGTNPEATYTIKLTVINPAGIVSEPKQVTEKTFYLYGVAKDGSGVSKLWCIDGPTSFADGVGTVVSEFNLVDEQGQNISASPLDIATSGNTIWVSFDDKKIRRYNVYAEPEKVDGTNWYWQVSNRPDGLYYDGGGLQYCSSSDNKIHSINGALGVISRRLAFDGEGEVPASITNHYTDQEYTGYNPTAISVNYLCSSSLNKMSKRSGNNYIPTLPTATPIWTNEQDTPAPAVGIVEITDNSVPGGRMIYLSSTNGNIYKVRFVDKTGYDASHWEKGVTTRIQYDINAGTSYLGYGESPSHTPAGKRQEFWANVGDARYKSDYIYTTIVRKYGKVYDYANRVLNPIKAYAVHKGYFRTVVDVIHYDFAYGGYGYSRVIAYPGLSLPADSTYRISYSFDDNWTLEQKFNSITEGKTLWVQHNDALSDTNTQYDPAQASIWGAWGPWYATLSPIWSITNVSENISTVPFFYTVQYNEEGEDFTGLFRVLYPGYVPVVDMWNPYDGFMVAADIHNGTGGEPLGPYWQPVIYWSFLLDEGSLEVLDQFTTPTGIWEGIGTGNRINMRIKTGYPSSINIGGTIQLEAHGKESLAWGTSDGNVGKVDSNGLFTAVGKGTCTVTVQDALGNMTTSGVITVQ